MDTAETVARGGQPVWEQEFEHPQLGKLTFKVEKMPTVSDWLRIATSKELYAPGIVGGVGGALAEALAGITTLTTRPVLEEKRLEDPDDPTHIKIEQILYEPLEDQFYEFPLQVWGAFTDWRAQTLSEEVKEQVKNSSGATSSSSSDSSDSSPDTTDSPQAS